MSPQEAREGASEPVEPPGMSVRAKAFWGRVVAEYDLADDEVELLAEAVHTMTEIDDLRARLEVDGLTVLGSTGQTRVHPAVNEIRQHRMALARLLKAVDLPSEDEEESWATKNARAAARSRWDMEKGRKRGTA